MVKRYNFRTQKDQSQTYAVSFNPDMNETNIKPISQMRKLILRG